MYACILGNFCGGPIFVDFMGIMSLFMKIRPMENLYSIEWV